MAAELAARGLSRGDRLAIHLANRVEFIDLYLACTRLGVIFVPMNVLYKERELRHIVGDAEPKAVVAARERRRSVSRAAPPCGTSMHSRARRPLGSTVASRASARRP